MVGYTYEYKSVEEIAQLLSFSSQGIGAMSLSVIAFVSVLVCIFLILPGCIISMYHIREQKEKKNKQRLLQQILIQKQIEDEVEKEIQPETTQKMPS